MSTIQFEKKTKGAKKIGMYIALLICILAIGVGYYTAATRIGKDTDSGDLAEVTTAYKTQPVIEDQSGVAAKTSTTAATTTTTVKPQTTISDTATFFILPVGGSIYKEFDDENLQYSDTYLDWRLHLGVDIAAEKGSEIHASGNGRVTDIYEDEIMGQTVVIDHGNGIIAYYSGVATPTVAVDDVVDAGQTIGGIGEIPSEIAPQYHLHFSVKKDNEWVDPIKELNITLS